MRAEVSSGSRHGKSFCGCGGHGHRSAPPDPRAILAMTFGEPSEPQCSCRGVRCPRHYLALAGLMLGGFLLLHLAINLLALSPVAFQAVVTRGHALGITLPVLEISLVFVPLGVHVGLGLRALCREKLKFGVEKHHHGSDLRHWLQRVSAVIMLVFIVFHLVTMHRWFGGKFDPHHAFSSASDALWHFWRGLPRGHPGNVLFAQLYLLGLLAMAYHLTNGLATGAAVLGLATTPAAQQRLWRLCRVAAPVLLLAGLVGWWAFAVK